MSASRFVLALAISASLTVIPTSAVGTAHPATATTATTAAVERQREGRCERGGEWRLRVRRVFPRRLRVTFQVHEVRRHRRWQMFLSDNGRGVAAVTRRTRNSDEVRVHRRIRNRHGRDRISGSAINTRNGNTCIGSLRF
ncbi:MAG: hypothetical protein ACRDOJ_09900 [Nocardioidaceae bacterium]